MAGLSNACRRRQLYIKMTQYAYEDQDLSCISGCSFAEKESRSGRQPDIGKPLAQHIHRNDRITVLLVSTLPSRTRAKVQEGGCSRESSPPYGYLIEQQRPRKPGRRANRRLDRAWSPVHVSLVAPAVGTRPSGYPFGPRPSRGSVRLLRSAARKSASVEAQGISQPAPMTRFA
ncbi:hypothetical protein CCUS01_00232 [Colletotrichum cuscutae]|uniref:Uncharacterized protein n=1 Tax=Colletotrichum cuscutae TaxID=1209917 RepID=A0AAI9YE19_9PEZI|nr:hypothetical protein CCUS01_00232 [Colletotrichum cuscutae]